LLLLEVEEVVAMVQTSEEMEAEEQVAIVHQ
jgi:hypothetical protein